MPPSRTPRGRSRAAAKPITIGVTGSGQLDKKAITALLDDLGDVELVYVPVTKDDFSDEVEAVYDWAIGKDIPVETMSDAAAVEDDDLKKVIDGGREDYPIEDGQTAAQVMLEFLAGDDDNPAPEGARLVFFFDPNQEYDVDAFAAADEVGVPCYDACNAMELMAFAPEDDADADPAAEADPEPDPPAEEPRRGRRGRALAAVPDPEPAESVAPEVYTEEQLKPMQLGKLKTIAKGLDSEVDTAYLKDRDKAFVIDLILGLQAGDGADAAQVADAEEKEAAGADEAQAGRDVDDAREVVFTRLRGQREVAENIALGMSKTLRTALEEGPPEAVIERVSGALAVSLMTFAEHIISEVRKPKSAGRPRADGSEAQPKPPVDPDAPRRGRGRPRSRSSE